MRAGIKIDLLRSSICTVGQKLKNIESKKLEKGFLKKTFIIANNFLSFGTIFYDPILHCV